MRTTALPSRKRTAQPSVTPDPVTTLRRADLPALGRDWLLEGDLRGHSPKTRQLREGILRRLEWFLKQEDHDTCGPRELRAFFAYLSADAVEGRWEEAQTKGKPRPWTVRTYHQALSVFCRFLVAEGALDASPMASVPAPILRQDQVRPFSPVEVERISAAARRAKYAAREGAILHVLLDTGVRASELCDLRMKDLDLPGHRLSVRGKGNKVRACYFGRGTTRALREYFRERRAGTQGWADPEEGAQSPIFASERGLPLTRSGLRQMLAKLGAEAGIDATRCSPHTCRHTFAVTFLRAGGNVFTLKELLGHTDLKMTNRYVALAEADIENQARAFSPMDQIAKQR